MTKKTRSELLTRKTWSEIGREASAYFAPNHRLCQNYAENGSFLTIHKSAQSSRIVECNLYQSTFYTLAKLPFTPTRREPNE